MAEWMAVGLQPSCDLRCGGDARPENRIRSPNSDVVGFSSSTTPQTNAPASDCGRPLYWVFSYGLTVTGRPVSRCQRSHSLATNRGSEVRESGPLRRDKRFSSRRSLSSRRWIGPSIAADASPRPSFREASLVVHWRNSSVSVVVSRLCNRREACSASIPRRVTTSKSAELNRSGFAGGS
jgi:hypothetical protein